MTIRSVHNRLLRVVITIALALLAGPGAAEDGPPVSTAHNLLPGVALDLAQAARTACHDKDFQVTVAVVDRGGVPLAALRDQLAGVFTWDIALAKARTAAGFRQPTLGLARALPDRPELAAIDRMDEVLMVGGGVPVSYEGAVVGAIGVSGAPTQEADHVCAEAAIEALADALMF